PQLLVHREGDSCSRLVKARVIVIFGRLVQSQRHVHPGTGEFARVDRAGAQRRDDLARRQVDHHGPEAAQHLAAYAGHAISQPLIRFHSRDFLREPASHLRTGIATRERLKAHPGAYFARQAWTAAVIDPRVDLWRREAKRYVAKVGERRGAARPSDFRAVVYVGKTRRDRVEGFERTDQLAGREYFDVQPTPGQ